jgi:hypothetical protein
MAHSRVTRHFADRLPFIVAGMAFVGETTPLEWQAAG